MSSKWFSSEGLSVRALFFFLRRRSSRSLRRIYSRMEIGAVESLSPLSKRPLTKKMSGRRGGRPLGRGGWRVLQPEASPVLPHVQLRSRAAERDTGANRPKPLYSGSRNQLPITVTILRSTLSSVDRPTGSFFSVLPGVPARLFLVPTYLFLAIRCFSHSHKAAKMRRTNEKGES